MSNQVNDRIRNDIIDAIWDMTDWGFNEETVETIYQLLNKNDFIMDMDEAIEIASDAFSELHEGKFGTYYDPASTVSSAYEKWQVQKLVKHTKQSVDLILNSLKKSYEE